MWEISLNIYVSAVLSKTKIIYFAKLTAGDFAMYHYPYNQIGRTFPKSNFLKKK